ncbi:hypothetical protein MPLSOD_410068 [Mesorhizobium sp. SOD10]|nr:hypothetical protein MPLSOD_410068 [Mesorhizobium sp. SOD10]
MLLRREPAYVGRQPDGSLALIAVWMTQEIALTMAVREAPRGHHLFQIAPAQIVSQVPAHTQEDHHWSN